MRTAGLEEWCVQCALSTGPGPGALLLGESFRWSSVTLAIVIDFIYADMNLLSTFPCL